MMPKRELRVKVSSCKIILFLCVVNWSLCIVAWSVVRITVPLSTVVLLILGFWYQWPVLAKGGLWMKELSRIKCEL